MREIQFRAWDKNFKKLVPVIAIDWHNQRLSEGIIGDTLIWYNIQKYILVQSMGLKDKNGKAIYEGDIVITENNKKNVCQVIYDHENAQFLIECNEWSSAFRHFSSYDLEIIGNIFENPELIKKI